MGQTLSVGFKYVLNFANRTMGPQSIKKTKMSLVFYSTMLTACFYQIIWVTLQH